MTKIIHGVQIIRGVQLEQYNELFDAESNCILDKYRLRSNIPSPIRMFTRNVAIYANEHKASDDKITEYLVGDTVVATIYARRNDYNTIDVYISYFD